METRDNLRRLEIGSGNRPTGGWLHMDADASLPELDYIGSMEKIPLPDNFLTAIKLTHVIEHVPIPTARLALKEFLRVLAPGGQVHLDTPNLKRNADLYLNGGWEKDFATLTPGEQEMCSLNGTPNKTLWVVFKCFSSPAQYDVHFANYDEELLPALCLDAGFDTAQVTQTEPSLIVTARKKAAE